MPVFVNMRKKFFDAFGLRSIGGELAAIADALDEGRNISVFGLGYSEKAQIVAHTGRPVFVVAKDAAAAEKLKDRISEWLPDGSTVYLPPKDDVLIYRKKFQAQSLAERMAALVGIASGKILCCVTCAETLLQYVPKKDRLQRSALSVAVGDEIAPDEIARRLTAMGYSRAETAEEKNTFALHGDILSVYPPDRDLPYRLSFFGDTVESVKTFDPVDMTTATVERALDLTPAGDLFITAEEAERAMEKARAAAAKESGARRARLEAILDELAAEPSQGQSFQWLLPWMEGTTDTVFDYLPANTLLVLDDPAGIADRMRLYLREHKERVESLAPDGEVCAAHMRCLATEEAAVSKLRGFVVAGFSKIRSTNTLFAPERTFAPRTAPIENYTYNVKRLYTDLLNYMRAGFATVLCMGDDATARTLTASLNAEDVPCRRVDDGEPVSGAVCVTPIKLSHGFCYPDARIAVIGGRDISKGRSERTAASKTRLFTLPKVGDYVVHEIHGIGRCIGVEKLEFQGIARDYVVIEYRDGGLLQVPIDQMDRLSRYSGSDRAPRLSKLGGKEFEKLKNEVRKSVRKLAIDLVKLYAERESVKGYRYEPDTDEQKRFEDAFPYEETPDQLQAVREIKEDMESGRVMDRLLCGDVGYGKTEVAFRAVFKTVIEAKQAVILAPTTILAKQHYQTACERFRDFGVNIELLTRYRTREETAKSLEDIAKGKTNIIIGTHRLLSGDVKFNDLGLIVLDEEQRFGVEHKEKLKLFNTGVNVLTLSATPIPRTLNMALTGIRDISVLETPPTSRIPVQTYVTELTDALLRDAVTRELARGGQAFILYNRVDGIESFAEKVKALLPEARVTVGHGQMDARTLEANVGAFYARTADVLVCTTIIENGIDVPDANTLIVCDADRLGLSQLYQLRGRVGRRNRLAYAYFTTPEGKVLTEDASKRLSAIMDFTEFGSGFKIAMRDLEIRGAGSVLGREQHGHIEKVGYDLYCKLLAGTVEELRSGKKEEVRDAEINVAVDAYLDPKYVSAVDQRLKIFAAISDVDGAASAWELVKTLTDSYGKPPAPLLNLINIGMVKNIAKKIGVKRVFVTDRAADVTFRDAESLRSKNVIDALSAMGDRCVLSVENEPKVVFECRYLPNEAKFAAVAEFLSKCV